MTAFGMLDICKKKGATCTIQNAASSALGKMVAKLFKQEGIETINIVRRDEYVKDLKTTLGLTHVLNQESPSFQDDIKKLCRELNPTVFFECVGGELMCQVFEKMNRKSELVIVGMLSGEHYTLNPANILMFEKTMRSFLVPSYVTSLIEEER